MSTTIDETEHISIVMSDYPVTRVLIKVASGNGFHRIPKLYKL